MSKPAALSGQADGDQAAAAPEAGESAQPPQRLGPLPLPAGMTRRQAYVLIAFAVAGVVGAFGLDLLLNQVIHLKPETVDRWVGRFGPWAPIVYVAGLAATVILTPIPSLPLDIAGGLAFGLWGGSAAILLASLLGATADFFIARALGRGFLVRHLKPETVKTIDGLAARLGGRVLFVLRIEPLFNFKWVSYAAGLTAMRYGVYALATLLGSALPAFGIAYVGATLLTHPGRSALVLSLLSLATLLPLALGTLAALFVGAKRLLTGRKQSSSP